MINTRLYLALQSLSNKELRLFSEFIQSPFFNKNKHLVALFLYLVPSLQKAKQIDLAKNAIYAHVFPSKTFDDKHYNHLKSQLYQLVEQFLAYQQFEASPSKDLYLLEAIVARKLHKSYNNTYLRTQKKLTNTSPKSIETLLATHQLAHLADKAFTATNKREFNHDFVEAADTFDEYWITQKLNYLCTMLSNQQFIEFEYNKTFFDPLQDWLQKHPPTTPLAQTYYYLLRTLSTPNESNKYFQLLVNNIHAHHQGITPATLKPILQMAINYCSKQIRAGHTLFVKEAMQLYKFGVAKALLLSNGMISPWTYKNMVKLGINLQDYKWLEDFILNYSQKLAPQSRDDAYHFSLADLYYAKKDFHLAQKHLNIVEFKDPLYYIGAKILLIKIYYEEESLDALEAALFAFKIYLKRNKVLSTQSKKPYENFIRFVNILQKQNTKQIASLQNKITNSICTEKRWLFKQINNN